MRTPPDRRWSLWTMSTSVSICGTVISKSSRIEVAWDSAISWPTYVANHLSPARLPLQRCAHFRSIHGERVLHRRGSSSLATALNASLRLTSRRPAAGRNGRRFRTVHGGGLPSAHQRALKVTVDDHHGDTFRRETAFAERTAINQQRRSFAERRDEADP